MTAAVVTLAVILAGAFALVAYLVRRGDRRGDQYLESHAALIDTRAELKTARATQETLAAELEKARADYEQLNQTYGETLNACESRLASSDDPELVLEWVRSLMPEGEGSDHDRADVPVDADTTATVEE